MTDDTRATQDSDTMRAALEAVLRDVDENYHRFIGRELLIANSTIDKVRAALTAPSSEGARDAGYAAGVAHRRLYEAAATIIALILTADAEQPDQIRIVDQSVSANAYHEFLNAWLALSREPGPSEATPSQPVASAEGFSTYVRGDAWRKAVDLAYERYPQHRAAIAFIEGGLEVVTTIKLSPRSAAAPAVAGSEPVAWRVLNDFGHWYVTNNEALANTYRDTEKKEVQPLYAAPPPAVALDREAIINLIQNEYDPMPDLGDGAYKAFEDSWDDGTGRIADAILSASRPAAEAERLDREALRTALAHIEHMSAWISNQNAGYSFESLGEDMPGMRAALETK